MHISYYTHILINATTLRHFTLLCATLLSLCAPLRSFTLLYSTLLYLGTSEESDGLNPVTVVYTVPDQLVLRIFHWNDQTQT